LRIQQRVDLIHAQTVSNVVCCHRQTLYFEWTSRHCRLVVFASNRGRAGSTYSRSSAGRTQSGSDCRTAIYIMPSFKDVRLSVSAVYYTSLACTQTRRIDALVAHTAPSI